MPWPRPSPHGGPVRRNDAAGPRRGRSNKNTRAKAGMTVLQANMSVAESASGRIRRHLLADRIYHWLMAACVLTLLATAFLPIIGYKFEWLGLHWTTGVALSV